MIEIKVEFYGSENRMKLGIKKMQNIGCEVVSTEAVDRGYNGLKFLADWIIRKGK